MLDRLFSHLLIYMCNRCCYPHSILIFLCHRKMTQTEMQHQKTVVGPWNRCGVRDSCVARAWLRGQRIIVVAEPERQSRNQQTVTATEPNASPRHHQYIAKTSPNLSQHITNTPKSNQRIANKSPRHHQHIAKAQWTRVQTLPTGLWRRDSARCCWFLALIYRRRIPPTKATRRNHFSTIFQFPFFIKIIKSY